MIKIIGDVLITNEDFLPGHGIGYYVHRNWIKGNNKFMDKHKNFDKFIYVKDFSNKALIEHELSHSKRLGAEQPILYKLSKGKTPGLAGIAAALITKKKRYAALTSLALSSPNLIEEGKANYDSFLKTKELGLPVTSMGSYAILAGLQALPAVAIASLAKKI